MYRYRPPINGLISLFSLLVALFVGFWIRGDQRESIGSNNIKLTCWKNIQNASEICRPICGDNFFSLPNMTTCYPWLDCDQINKEIIIQDAIERGLVKVVTIILIINIDFKIIIQNISYKY